MFAAHHGDHGATPACRRGTDREASMAVWRHPPRQSGGPRMKGLRFIWCLVLALSAATSFASVTVTIQESGADVVAEATGSIVLPACISTASIAVTGTLDFVASGNFAYVAGQGSSEGCTIGFTVAQPLHSAPISAAAARIRAGQPSTLGTAITGSGAGGAPAKSSSHGHGGQVGQSTRLL